MHPQISTPRSADKATGDEYDAAGMVARIVRYLAGFALLEHLVIAACIALLLSPGLLYLAFGGGQ